MEVKEKSKKRELIKTIAIIFLAVLLVLTFFSQTIMNHSLPEVATQVVSSGTINAKIRVSGTVAANESYEVMLGQTRTVRSVCVKAGDKVEEGTLLFVLEDMESQELATAQQELSQLQIDYQTKILNFSKEYATDDLSVKNIREDLQKAMEQRDASVVNDFELSYAKGDLAAAKTQLAQLELTIADLTEAQNNNEVYNDAKAKVDELTAEIKALTTTLEGYQEDLEKLDTGATLETERKIRDAQTALDKAQTKWQADWNAYRQFIQQLLVEISIPWSSNPHAFTSGEQVIIDGALKRWELLAAGSGSNTTPGDKEEGETGGETRTYTAAGSGEYIPQDPYTVSQYRTAYNALIADQEDVASKQEALARAQQDQAELTGTANEQRQTIQNKIGKAQSDMSAAQSKLREAQVQMDAASGANTQVKEQLRVCQNSKREQETAITTLEEKLAGLEKRKEAYEAALEAIATKERELESAISGKDIDKQLDNLELQTLRLQIEQKQELVNKYRTESVDTEIKSKVTGIVSAVNVSAGKDTTPDSAMAVIDVVDRGYTIKVPVTSEQAKQVKVGDTADVTNRYWGSDITATLEQIAPDPENPGQKKLLVFRITGDVEAGSTINLSIGQQSMPSDTIVPKSALREDTNGKFVLVVTSRNTPLGNRYIATRVDVEVLGEDDTSAAVSGVAANDYVITTSSKPLDAGTQVRMVENS